MNLMAMEKIHFLVMHTTHTYVAVGLGVLVVVLFILNHAPSIEMKRGLRPLKGLNMVYENNITPKSTVSRHHGTAPSRLLMAQPLGEEGAFREESETWKHAATPSPTPPPRPILAGVHYVAGTYYKEYTGTVGHRAVHFAQRKVPRIYGVQAIQSVLPALIDFLENVKAPYWLDWGTLLGAWRNQTVILWDDDGDVAILPGEDIGNIAEAASKFPFDCSRCLFVVRFNYTWEDIPFVFIDQRTGTCIDVFQYVERGQGNMITNEVFPTYSPNRQPYNHVLPASTCILEQRKYKCPRMQQEYLVHIYGDLSPLEPCERVCKVRPHSRTRRIEQEPMSVPR